MKACSRRVILLNFVLFLFAGLSFSTTILREDTKSHAQNKNATCAVCVDSSQCCGDLMCFQHRCVDDKNQLEFCEGNLPCAPCESVFDCSYGLCIRGFCVQSRDGHSECETEKNVSTEGVKEKENLRLITTSTKRSMSDKSKRFVRNSNRFERSGNEDFIEKSKYVKDENSLDRDASKLRKSHFSQERIGYSQETDSVDVSGSDVDTSSGGDDEIDEKGVTVRGASDDYDITLYGTEFSVRQNLTSNRILADASNLGLNVTKAPHWDGVEGIHEEGEDSGNGPPDWDGAEGVMNSGTTRLETTAEADDFEDDDDSDETNADDIKELSELLQLFDVDRDIIENLKSEGSDWAKEDESLAEKPVNSEDINVRGVSCRAGYTD